MADMSLSIRVSLVLEFPGQVYENALSTARNRQYIHEVVEYNSIHQLS